MLGSKGYPKMATDHSCFPIWFSKMLRTSPLFGLDTPDHMVFSSLSRARYSSMVREFAYSVMGHRIDSSWWTL